MNSLTESVTSLETLLEQFDAVSERLKTAQIDVESTQADLDHVLDDATLSVEQRAKRITHLRALLEVLQADANKLQSESDAQKKQLAKDSDEVRGLLTCRANEKIHDTIREHVAALKQQYDVSGFPGLELLVSTHETIVQLKRVESGLGNYTMHDAAGQLEAARRFRRDVLEKLS